MGQGNGDGVRIELNMTYIVNSVNKHFITWSLCSYRLQISALVPEILKFENWVNMQMQGLKLRLTGRQCDQKLSAGD